MAIMSLKRVRTHSDLSRRAGPDATVAQRTGSRTSKSGRESIESFVVVFLCFLIWSLEAEGFVIPTGSMAPTLMGRHKEIACPQCGFLYAVNASQEADNQSPAHAVHSGLCVNCRYQAINLDTTPSYKGDRILVMMFPYDLPFLPG